MHRRCRLVGTLIFLAFAPAAADVGEERQPNSGDEVATCLRLIRTAGPAVPPAPDATDEDRTHYWVAVLDEAASLFAQLTRVEPERRRANLRRFAAEFGRHGPQADFRWVLAAGEHLVTAGPRRPWPGDDERSRLARDVMRDLHEAMVREFLARPESLHRFYRAVLWSPYVFTDRNNEFSDRLNFTTEGLLGKEGRPDDYCWHSLNALLFMHATARDDLLKDAAPERIGEVFRQWTDWMAENGPDLRPNSKTWHWEIDLAAKTSRSGDARWAEGRGLPMFPDRPTSPLPDWEGVPPPAPEFMNDAF